MPALKFKSRVQSRPATNLQVSTRGQPGASPLGLEQYLESSCSAARHRVAHTCQVENRHWQVDDQINVKMAYQVGLPVPPNDLVDQIVVPFPQYVWEGSSCRRPTVSRMLAVGTVSRMLAVK